MLVVAMIPVFYRHFLIIILCLSLLAPGFVFADNTTTDIAAQQAELQQQLNLIQQQINSLQGQIAETTSQKNTLANKIKQLQQEQASLKLQIKAAALELKQVQDQLIKTEKSISSNTAKQERLKNQLGALVRLINTQDQELPIFRLVAQGGWSDAFIEVTSYQTLIKNVGLLTEQTKQIARELQNERQDYSDKEDDAAHILSMTKIQQGALTDKVSEQNELLKETKGREADYQKLLADNQKRAAEIKSRMYELLGGGKQIDFGEAVTIATWVSGQVDGVEPAFVLAILTQESSLGKNVGTCNRLGDPPEKSWKVIMKPDRDQEPFKTITTELGRDIDVTPVSCPMKNKDGSQLGWGGAMGPAQFIPSTWIGYKDKVTKITGKSADPWDIRDAFVAAAILLKANGADGTDDGYWKAAMRYFSGSTNTKYRFYGDNVLKTTQKYREDIKALGQ